MIVRYLAGFVASFSFTSLVASVPLQAQTVDQDFVVNKLREYCKACHAVGELKFIGSPDNQQVWDFIWQERSPRSGGVWGDLIIEVLDWPNAVPPPPDELLDPPNRDWMPKGNKRNQLAADHIAGQSVRDLILDYLQTSP